MENNYKIGIIGCGVIGGVMKQWLETYNPNVCIKVSDPPKGLNDDLSDVDIAFVSIHIPTESDGTQDLTLLKNLIKNLPDIPVFIRTTLLPNTCDALSQELGKKVYFMPEFLTERTAYEDFCNQPMIFTGEEKMMSEIFKGKKYVTMSNKEAEITKYAHNVFGAVKVTFFNGIYELSQKEGCDFAKIREGVLLSEYINAPHTQVPGPDGKLGYGGKCFPKDVNAFAEFIKDTNLFTLIDDVHKINNVYRGL